MRLCLSNNTMMVFLVVSQIAPVFPKYSTLDLGAQSPCFHETLLEEAYTDVIKEADVGARWRG